MDDDRLAAYLIGHAPVLQAEVELVSLIRLHCCHGDFSDFLDGLILDIEEEREALAAMMQTVGPPPGAFDPNDQILMERIERLRNSGEAGMDCELLSFSSLEQLFVAAEERRSLWEVLEATQHHDRRFYFINFARFRERARRHCDALNAQRLLSAKQVLARRPMTPGAA